MKMPEGTLPKDQYLSTLYAILEGASSALDISRDDISGCVSGNGELILYDDTAGGSGFTKHIYENFEKVLREAKHKVSGICECTEETSCYGCLRNYSNQYYHDDLSRGLAYHYLDWLINDETKHEEEYNLEHMHIKTATDEEETLGLLKSNYDVPDTSAYEDTSMKLESLMGNADDDSIKKAYKKLLEAAKSRTLEHPIDDNMISVEERIWPELFWGNSHVALFAPEALNQYNILRKYDWYCYILDENIDANRVISHIKSEGED
jgi:hypothetical protein